MNKENKLIRADLTSEINEVESALLECYKNMQMVDEDELVDYYAYKIKSEEAKHKYLLNKIKEIEWNFAYKYKSWYNIYYFWLTLSRKGEKTMEKRFDEWYGGWGCEGHPAEGYESVEAAQHTMWNVIDNMQGVKNLIKVEVKIVDRYQNGRYWIHNTTSYKD